MACLGTRHWTLLLLVLVALALVVKPSQAWSSPRTPAATAGKSWLGHQRRSTSSTSTKLNTVSIPVDNFGNVNGNDDDNDGDDDLEYYNPNSDQTIFPCLQDWTLVEEDHTLRGVVWNHPSFQDGDAISTSELYLEEGCDSLELRPEEIVSTVTGSQYLLGEPLVVELKQWKQTSAGHLTGIVAHEYPHVNLVEGQTLTTASKIQLPHSLNIAEYTKMKSKDGLDNDNLLLPLQQGQIVTTDNGHLYALLEPYTVPLLQQWKRLEGGSIAGFVFSHPTLPDNELVTTSPLVELDESQDGIILVTTASGSQYQLGEPEPPKVYSAVVTDEEEEEETVDDGIYYGEDDDDDEEEAGSSVPVKNGVPKTTPQHKQPDPVLQHIFASAADGLHQFIQEEQAKLEHLQAKNLHQHSSTKSVNAKDLKPHHFMQESSINGLGTKNQTVLEHS